MEGAVNVFIASMIALMIIMSIKSWWRDRESRTERGIVSLSHIAIFVDGKGKFYPAREHSRTYLANWKLFVAWLLIAPTLGFLIWG